jgi:hypothetical protein
MDNSSACLGDLSPAAGRPRRSYVGGCDCGRVRYEVQLTLHARDPRTRSVWEHSVAPHHFVLHSGHESLIGYQFAAENVHHFFCTRCQARAFSHCAPSERDGYYTIDLKALYGRELAQAQRAALR